MALSKADLLRKLEDLNIKCDTIGHALSPTCEEHSVNIKGTKLEKYIGKGQAKNLFFKVPSGGGPLKGRLFLVCALVETTVDNKVLSSRLGIKASAPLRFADDSLFTDVLQIPKGSVNPFVMAQSSCDDVMLLLDKNFLQCEGLLFHPMQSDFTTSLTPDQLTSFLEQVAPGRYMYVDLTTNEKITLPEAGAKAKAATSGKQKAEKAESPAAASPSAKATSSTAKHGFRDSKLPDALSSAGLPIIADPIGKLNSAGRLEGHSTHNFFVHDKKSKDKRFLVTVAQASGLDMKSIPELVGAKEVRLCTEGDTLLGSAKGCITPLSLFYDSGKAVQWFIDDALLADKAASWRLGTSEDGAAAGTVVDIPISKLEKLLGATGHWAAKKVIDCTKFGSVAVAESAAPQKSAAPVSSPAVNTEPSTWYQPPYKTALGFVL